MKRTLERRIAKLERVLKNEAVDFEKFANSLRDNQEEIADAASNLRSKFRKLVTANPDIAELEYDIPESAYKALDKAVEALDEAKGLVIDARRILDGLDDQSITI